MKRWILSAACCVFLSTTCTAKPMKITQWDTKTGVHVMFYQAMEVPMLDAVIAFKAGSAYDGDAYGLSALTTRLLNQGNSGVNADIIAERLAQTGAQFAGSSAQDMVALSLKTLVRQDALQQAVETFASIIAHPDFTEEAFQHQKNQQLMSLAEAEDSPDAVANQTFFQTLYRTHPYAHPILGDKSHVNQITLKQVRTFYTHHFVGQNATLVLVGALDERTAKRLSERLTEDLEKGEPAAPIPAAHEVTEALDIEVRFPAKQTMFRLGQLGITHADPDYFPLMVGNFIFGGGFEARLSQELREKRGLTYGVSSQFLPMFGKGPFIIGFSTKHKTDKMAIDITREKLASFVKEGPTARELSAAIHYLTGSFPLSLASNRNMADVLLKMSFYHLPNDYLQTYLEHINAVSLQDIKAAFQRHIIPTKLIQVSVGK